MTKSQTTPDDIIRLLCFELKNVCDVHDGNGGTMPDCWNKARKAYAIAVRFLSENKP